MRNVVTNDKSWNIPENKPPNTFSKGKLKHAKKIKINYTFVPALLISSNPPH